MTEHADAVDIWLNGRAYWANVPKPVREYTLGGYQVIKKWLSYRERDLLGRDLHNEEARYVTEMVRRIAAILALGPALDASYEAVKANVWAWEGRSSPQPTGSSSRARIGDRYRGVAVIYRAPTTPNTSVAQ